MKLNFEINRPAAFVFSCLSSPQRFVKVHPVISKIEKHSEKGLLVYETLKFAGIPISFTYPATIISDKQGQMVLMKAIVMKMVRVEMKFTIYSLSANHCRVEEEVNFRSWLPVHIIMRRIFRKQHALLFKNIELCHE